jgi:hypothetical protein
MSQQMDPREETAEELRRRVHALDDRLEPPADLFERISSPRWRSGRRTAVPLMVAAAVTVCALVLGVAAGAAWMRHRQAPQSLHPGSSVGMVVYNAEKPCQNLRTIECALSVTSDPRHPAPDKVVARVWHGDKVTATCVIPDGVRIVDEEGVSTNRWYRIVTADGITGYLAGIRTHNTVEVALCQR